MNKLQKYNLFCIVSRLFESMFWMNIETLKEDKIRFQSSLLFIKTFNKKVEKELSEDGNICLDDAVSELYDIVETTIKHTQNGRGNEFIEYLKKFK